MRVGIGIAACALMLATSAHAVTFTGVINPVDGFAFFNFPWEPDPGFEFDEGKTQVSFSINNGVIYEASTGIHLHFSYDIIPSDPNQAPWGNDYGWDEGCFFNGPGEEGCYNTTFPYEPNSAQQIGNFSVGQRSLSFTVTKPESFDNCDNSVFDVDCRHVWTTRPEYADIKIASYKPISWSLSFKNVAVAVPEPASWAMMIAGFGLAGGTLRLRRNRQFLRFGVKDILV